MSKLTPGGRVHGFALARRSCLPQVMRLHGSG
jgi:hypothetical protein